jgi:hypothetical protein
LEATVWRSLYGAKGCTPKSVEGLLVLVFGGLAVEGWNPEKSIARLNDQPIMVRS